MGQQPGRAAGRAVAAAARGGGAVRRVAFLFELSLEGPDGALLWRGRAVGRTHLSETGRIARPLAPLLIERLGCATPAREFAR